MRAKAHGARRRGQTSGHRRARARRQSQTAPIADTGKAAIKLARRFTATRPALTATWTACCISTARSITRPEQRNGHTNGIAEIETVRPRILSARAIRDRCSVLPPMKCDDRNWSAHRYRCQACRAFAEKPCRYPVRHTIPVDRTRSRTAPSLKSTRQIFWISMRFSMCVCDSWFSLLLNQHKKQKCGIEGSEYLNHDGLYYKKNSQYLFCGIIFANESRFHYLIPALF